MIRMSIMSVASLLSTVSFAAADLGGGDSVTHLNELEQDIANHTGETVDVVDSKLTFLSELTGEDKTVIAQSIDELAQSGGLDQPTEQDDINSEGDPLTGDLMSEAEFEEDLAELLEEENSDEAANGDDDDN
jgi:hypothetical protein